MKKNILILFGFIVSFMLGACAVVNAGAIPIKIATIDVVAIARGSNEVMALRAYENKERQALNAYMQKAKTEVLKEKDKTKQTALQKKHIQTYKNKQNKLQEHVAKKSNAIDKKIYESIKSYADTKGYNLVFSKSALIYGGEDISAEIIKIINK
ncbi:OmpH family outer membrane protein [bacterium]|nr:OmpH family outer membrane protein [bacterium]